MRRLCIAVLVPLVVGCSIMDPEDRAELRRQIAMLPHDKLMAMKRWTMHELAKEWLETRDENDQVGKVICRDNEGGLWSGWYDRPNKYITVADMLTCLRKKPDLPSYLFCAEEFARYVVPSAQSEIKALLPEFTDIECKYVWDFRYDPEKVDPKMIDIDAIESDDIIQAMITLPGPPPGWAIPRFAPLLCPLGAGEGWECPPRPSDSFPTGGEPTDPPGGDQP